MITFSQGGALKIKSKQFSEFGSQTYSTRFGMRLNKQIEIKWVKRQLLDLITSFLSNCQHRASVNGKSSEKKCISADVPSGSVPGLL